MSINSYDYFADLIVLQLVIYLRSSDYFLVLIKITAVLKLTTLSFNWIYHEFNGKRGKGKLSGSNPEDTLEQVCIDKSKVPLCEVNMDQRRLGRKERPHQHFH